MKEGGPMYKISKNLFIIGLIVCSVLTVSLPIYAQPAPLDNETYSTGPAKAHEALTVGSEDSGMTINFDQVDLNEALRVLIKEGLHANYVVSPRVTGRITIHSIGEIKKDQLLPLIETILTLNNLGIVKKDDIYYIVPQKEAPGLEDKISITQGVYVYPIENADAEEIANLLKQLFGGKVEKKPGKVIVPAKKQKGPLPTAAQELIAEVIIIPDKVNNFLIVKATPADYQMIEKVIKKLDIIPRQVVIETLLTEVTLTKSIEYGVEWFLKHRGQKYIGNISLSEQIKLSPAEAAGETAKGFTYSLFTTPGQLRALIKTLAEVSEVNILSTPLILVTDNTEASIKIAEEWPIPRETISEGGVRTVSADYKEVGILLSVKPHISSAGLVKLELTQEISSVLEKAAVGEFLAFLKREAKSSLVAQSGQTIVLGGIFKTEKTRSTSGIPLLKDIPLLGFLFGHKSWKTTKTELLIALTPRVIRSEEEAKTVNKEFLEKIEELKKRTGVKEKGKS